MEEWKSELVKAGLAFLVAAASLLVGSSLGQRLTTRWEERKKRRELELTALSDFYRLYGEFFAVWKTWETFNPRTGATYIKPETDIPGSYLNGPAPLRAASNRCSSRSL
jgi:hypothetical protein